MTAGFEGTLTLIKTDPKSGKAIIEIVAEPEEIKALTLNPLYKNVMVLMPDSVDFEAKEKSMNVYRDSYIVISTHGLDGFYFVGAILTADQHGQYTVQCLPGMPRILDCKRISELLLSGHIQRLDDYLKRYERLFYGPW